MKVTGFFKKYLLVSIGLSIGLFLTVGCTASPNTPPATNGEKEPTAYQMEIDLLGIKYEAMVDSQGKLESSTLAASADSEISLSIDSGTIVLDSDKNPLQTIEAVIDPNPPPLPEGADYIGPVYDLRPQGASFNPPLKLTLSYDPAQLPQGPKENDVYIACYADGRWEAMRYKQVDTKRHLVTTQIEHFSKYAVLILNEQSTPTPEPSPTPGADRVDVVYFHRTNRCYSCNYAEAATLYALEAYFQEELDSGKLTFESVNVQDDSNAAIIKKYGAYTSQLFINTVTGDTEPIEHVTEIWNFIGDDEGFTLLIRTKVTNALEGTS